MTENNSQDTPDRTDATEAQGDAAGDEAASSEAPAQFVADLTPIPHQIGERILESLATPGTVAVLSTVVTGLNRDRLVLVPLDRKQVAGVQQVIDDVQSQETDVPQIGFHHVIAQRKLDEQEAQENGDGDNTDA